MKENSVTPTTRNLALDFFRGYALLVIFINHMPSNPLADFTPSRFGFSDAAEIFVFLSGYASALAYGPVFALSGMGLGTLRVLMRCGQIYVAHLGIFFAMATLCVFGNALPGGHDYILGLFLNDFFDFTAGILPALFTLRYVPNYFDILPLYCVMMLWVPVVWALSRFHRLAALALPLALYLAMWYFHLEMSATPLTDLPWYFNPFGWQLMFFTGFALGSGWVKSPAETRGLLAACALFVLVSIPLGHEVIYGEHPGWENLLNKFEPWLDKSHLGPLRWLHFMALAYLVVYLLREHKHWLETPYARRLTRIGQHALPVFLFSMPLSYLGGMALDQTDRTPLAVILINLGGILLIDRLAQLIAWIQSKPWKNPAVNEIGAASQAMRESVALRGQAGLCAAIAGLLSLGPRADESAAFKWRTPYDLEREPNQYRTYRRR